MTNIIKNVFAYLVDAVTAVGYAIVMILRFFSPTMVTEVLDFYHPFLVSDICLMPNVKIAYSMQKHVMRMFFSSRKEILICNIFSLIKI